MAKLNAGMCVATEPCFFIQLLNGCMDSFWFDLRTEGEKERAITGSWLGLDSNKLLLLISTSDIRPRFDAGTFHTTEPFLV
jgi:hypothetical protein